MLNLRLADLKQLLDSSGDDMLSLYLLVDNSVEANQGETPGWKINLKNNLRHHEQALKQAGTWQAINEQIDSFLANFVPGAKTLAIFVTADDLQSYELPIRIEDQAYYGKPYLTPLLWAMDEFPHYLIVTVDKQQARFMHAYLGSSSQTDEMESDIQAYDFGEKTIMPATSRGMPNMQGTVTEGSHRDEFEDTLEAHEHRFLKAVADRTRELASRIKADHVILGGSERAANKLRDLLHNEIQQKVIDVLKIPVEIQNKTVMQQINQAVLNAERSADMDIVTDTINRARTEGGRGALGYDAVMKALEMQQVEILLLPWPLEDNEREWANELPQRVMEMGGTVEFVHDEAAARLREEGGVAARLYYAISEPS